MNDAAPPTLGSYIRVKHGCAFKGEYFTEDETPYVLVTPGNFAIGGGFLTNKTKYYTGPVPDDYILQEGDLVVTMTDLSKFLSGNPGFGRTSKEETLRGMYRACGDQGSGRDKRGFDTPGMHFTASWPHIIR